MGWLDPARAGGPLMQDTDMVVAGQEQWILRCRVGHDGAM